MQNGIIWYNNTNDVTQDNTYKLYNLYVYNLYRMGVSNGERKSMIFI
ncbi:MAG: hypothetical protein K0S01_2487 [Herbinix sp.]|jgi:hypothetical protein|nr:hypothetical protein [Herbinix sp.]